MLVILFCAQFVNLPVAEKLNVRMTYVNSMSDDALIIHDEGFHLPTTDLSVTKW